jgi:hypothetical protein
LWRIVDFWRIENLDGLAENIALRLRRTRKVFAVLVQEMQSRRMSVLQSRRISMRKILVIAALGLLLAGCQTARQDRQLGGALLGGAAGGVIGGVATRSTGGALVGGLIGAVAGTVIADETRPRGRCYARTPSGRRVRVAC